ncbi:MAG: hypothetical protein SNJ84_05535 [Verrucomicrobiia bacterium]
MIPLKARAVARDWGRVEALFHRTLGSVCGQTEPWFRVVVVGHDRPSTPLLERPEVTWLKVSSPVPEGGRTETAMEDKWLKVAEGLVMVGQGRPVFVMIVDADDLVSNRLAAHVRAHPNRHGWIIRKGYRYREGSPWVELDPEFNCGTNAIVAARQVRFPRSNTPEERAKCILLCHGHTVIERAMADEGRPLDELPFPGAVYVWGHGDNDSHRDGREGWRGLRYLLGKVRRSRPLTRRLRQEFNL